MYTVSRDTTFIFTCGLIFLKYTSHNSLLPLHMTHAMSPLYLFTSYHLGLVPPQLIGY